MDDYLQAVQGQSGMQKVLSAEMLNRAGRAVTLEERQKVKDEFMAIFYKELVKQAMKPDQLFKTEDSSSFSAAFGGDFLAEKMALELARSRSFSGVNIFPEDIEGNIQNR